MYSESHLTFEKIYAILFAETRKGRYFNMNELDDFVCGYQSDEFWQWCTDYYLLSNEWEIIEKENDFYA